MFDEHRSEALLVLDLHAVEDATVGIDANEQFFRRFGVAQNLCGIAHKILSQK
jgi:hypothetical protein